MRSTTRLYLVYGAVVLALLGWAEYRGWGARPAGLAGQDQPRSVRENPGAYRPAYRGTGRYTGGK